MSATILIADDEPNILISLEFLLRRAGYQVGLARDGQQALDAILQAPPALVLLDVMMPIMSGLAVLQAVRADARCHGVRVLLLSAKGRDTDVAKGLALGADAYMTKPFATQDLLHKVRELLGTPP